jgi:hypothetical protein
MAAGSHSTWPSWAPRRCSVCDERVVLSGPNARGAVFRFNVERGEGSSRHDCGPYAVVRVER